MRFEEKPTREEELNLARCESKVLKERMESNEPVTETSPIRQAVEISPEQLASIKEQLATPNRTETKPSKQETPPQDKKKPGFWKKLFGQK